MLREPGVKKATDLVPEIQSEEGSGSAAARRSGYKSKLEGHQVVEDPALHVPAKSFEPQMQACFHSTQSKRLCMPEADGSLSHGRARVVGDIGNWGKPDKGMRSRRLPDLRASSNRGLTGACRARETLIS